MKPGSCNKDGEYNVWILDPSTRELNFLAGPCSMQTATLWVLEWERDHLGRVALIWPVRSEPIESVIQPIDDQ